MSTVCWCGREECPSHQMEAQECFAALEAEVERLTQALVMAEANDERAELKAEVERLREEIEPKNEKLREYDAQERELQTEVKRLHDACYSEACEREDATRRAEKAEAEAERLRGELDRETDAHAGTAGSHVRMRDRAEKAEAAHVESQMNGAKEAIARKDIEALLAKCVEALDALYTHASMHEPWEWDIIRAALAAVKEKKP